MYYVVGRDHVNLRVSSPTAQYWCSHTTTVMGPDDVPCSPETLPAPPGLLRDGVARIDAGLGAAPPRPETTGFGP